MTFSSDKPMRSSQTLLRDATLGASRSLNRSFVPPDWVSINLTLRCNLHCTMCNTCYDVPDELSREEIFDIIDQVALWGVRILNPLGGEPFVRPDLVEILEYACRKDFYITLTTNGTLITPEVASGIARIAYDRLHFNFSLDGFAEVHDKIRGAGMLEQSLKGLKALRAADQAVGNPPRKVGVNTVVNNLNLETLPAFLEFCRSEGFQGVQLLNLFKKAGPEVPRDIKHLWIGRERWSTLDQVVETLRAFKRASDPLHFTLFNTEHQLDIMKLYYRGTLPPRQARCYAGWKELYINADGQAIMCDGKLDFLNGAFGNVRDQTLLQLWESDALRARREVVRACESPCIQDCYLRENSDDMLGLVKELGMKVARKVIQRVPLKRRRLEVPRGSSLTLELSDVSDVCPAHAPGKSIERFEALAGRSSVPFERCYEDPFFFYEMRNVGHLSFNRGFMGLELIQRSLPELKRAGVKLDAVRLGHRGDPLLHPELTLVLRTLLAEVGPQGVFGELQVQTYGTLLNTEYVDTAIEAHQAPQTWIFQVDAGTAEGYAQRMGKPLLPVVQARLAYLLAMKARHKASHVRIVLQLTALPETLEECETFVTFWKRRFQEEGLEPPGVRVGALPARVPGETLQDLLLVVRKDDTTFLEQLRSKEVFQAHASRLGQEGVELDRDRGHAPRCAAPFKTPTVTWDGKVTVCEQDRFLKLRVGEVTTTDLVDIWWRHEGVKELRRAVLRGELHMRMPCRDCRQPFSPNAPELGPGEGEEMLEGSGGWPV